MGQATDAYRRLRDRTDSQSGLLVDIHCKHLACRPGCHDCCTDLTVSPVEYGAILEDLRAAAISVDDLRPVEAGAACAFLSEGLCGLYRYRPLICRTHGLPIVFLNDDLSPPEPNVSFCPKNFTSGPAADVEFDSQNTLDIDSLNAALAEANLQYQQEQSAGADAATTNRRPRIPLRQLRVDLSRR